MRIIFAGTPAFAVPALNALLSAHTILAVYTQPDRPAGRGLELKSSPVKELAQKHRIQVQQPHKLGESLPALRAAKPDVMIVVAYGMLLPPPVLTIPTFGCINVHASLLPRWRGAAPIARAIQAGDTRTGATIMQMDEDLDTGPILAQLETDILATDTAASLHDRLANLGADLLLSTIAALAGGGLRPRAQDEVRASYARKLGKEEAAIDWAEPAVSLHRKIRALNPAPVARTKLAGEVLRIWDVGPLTAATTERALPGTILRCDTAGIYVQTGAGTLVLTRLQAAGARVLHVSDFLNGHPLAPGDRFD